MNIDYYFKNINSITFNDLFINCDDVCDVYNKIIPYIENKVGNKQECLTEINNNISIKGNYIIGSGTTISDFVVIEGPVIIGKNVKIMPGVLIRPYTIISDNCEIGHGSEIKHAFIMNNAKIASHVFVGDSIIGFKARIGSGTITANRRFDQKNITIKYQDKIYDLKKEFFGSIIGDSTRLGANSTTCPGTFIGPYTWIFPNTVVKGFIPELKKVSNVLNLYITENEKYDLK